jgi:alginate O-acetyltransferase complex protein AlgJ
MRAAAPSLDHRARGGPTDPSHDADLRRGILHTRLGRPLATALCLLFLIGIWVVPIAQVVLQKVRGEDAVEPELFRRAPTRANLKQWEEDLEKANYARDFVRPRVQELLSRAGFGNVKAVIGRGGWLFYKPGVMAVTGAGFLDADVQLARRRQARDDGDTELHPDPRPAVLALHRALAARGIRLVLFPVPDKATMQPAELHGRARGVVPAEGNRDLGRFEAELRAAGVAVFDPTPATVDTTAAPRFLAQDTHWTPAWMAEVARALAAFVTAEAHLPPPQKPASWHAVPQTVSRVGDIVTMLQLSDAQTLFAPQTITVAQVQDEGGQPWQPSASADVLLMGDSFANIFTMPAMGWGEAAGLGPQLTLALGRAIDVIAQNDAGAHATRELLSQALGAGEDRLAGKRVVIWELASRELAVGDFRPYGYGLGKAP